MFNSKLNSKLIEYKFWVKKAPAKLLSYIMINSKLAERNTEAEINQDSNGKLYLFKIIFINKYFYRRYSISRSSRRKFKR